MRSVLNRFQGRLATQQDRRMSSQATVPRRPKRLLGAALPEGGVASQLSYRDGPRGAYRKLCRIRRTDTRRHNPERLPPASAYRSTISRAASRSDPYPHLAAEIGCTKNQLRHAQARMFTEETISHDYALKLSGDTAPPQLLMCRQA